MTAAPTERQRRLGSLEVLLVVLIALAVSAGAISAFVAGSPDLSTAATVFCGVFARLRYRRSTISEVNSSALVIS